jgi:hypothetical protein
MKSTNALLAAAVALVGCGQAGSKQAPAQAQEGTPAIANMSEAHEHHLIVEWDTKDDLAALAAGSDAVIHGHVQSQRPAHVPRPELDRKSLTPEQAEEVLFTPETDSDIVVDEVVLARAGATDLNGAALGAHSTITVRELGGVGSDGCMVQPTDKPLMKTGEEVFLFLNAAGPGRFHAGSFQNRFTVREGQIVPLAASVHPGSLLDSYKGMSTAEFAASIPRAAP